MEPEHLRSDGARLGRARSRAVLVLVLAVVVALVVLRLARQDADVSPRLVPTPTPTPAVAPSSAVSHGWPTDLPPGRLFVGSEGWVQTVGSRDGTLTRTRVAAGSRETSMTPLGDGVLVWGTASSAKAVVTVDGTVRTLSGALRSATSFLPGPDGSVWAARDRGSARTTWRRVDADGRASTSVDVEGRAASDGAGGLVSVTDGGFRSVAPASARARQAGDVIATGPDGYVRRTCRQAECRFSLHRHEEEPDTELTTAVGEDTTGGTLSPTNRFLAVTETVGGTSTVRVSVVSTGEIGEIFDEPRGSTSDAVWLDDRWLALISEDQLMLYDARDDRIVVPAVALSSVGPLAWLPA